jgi:DNA-binding MarR family transcriptional regulator
VNESNDRPAIRVGLVRRIASQTDGRSSHLEHTTDGSKALEVKQRFRMRFFVQLMSEWCDQEGAEFGHVNLKDLQPRDMLAEQCLIRLK